MNYARLISGTLLLLLGVAGHRHASACSGPPPRSDVLRWRDGAFIALLAPTAGVVRVGPDVSRSPGSLRCAADYHAVLQTDATALLFRPDYDDPPAGCVPRALASMRASVGATRGRPFVKVPAYAYVGVFAMSPSGTRVAIQLTPVMDDETTCFAIINVSCQ